MDPMIELVELINSILEREKLYMKSITVLFGLVDELKTRIVTLEKL